ncbi:hypothetical protein [Mucilaginibacter paludis]|uniref:Uncharacterized protein n=1 Tax=Mucilaginibacter paludis DSM 18603 TaxID=714943 RepID=H1Y8M6_9SPHI|nr:hypothetical protein [Mucilaginibacter paludis]EHQ26898.1 hypothetical protein Mucpa_2787 [Mucilaginibacter paludis DSM 18603]
MEEVYTHELNVIYGADQKVVEKGGRKAIIQQIDVIHKRIKNATDKYYDLITEEQEYRA